MSHIEELREDITIKRGDTFAFTFWVTDVDGNPRNITGSTVTFAAKYGTQDLVYALEVDGTPTDYAAGKLAFSIPASDTALLHAPAVLLYDITLVEAGLDVTLQSGRLTVLPDVLT